MSSADKSKASLSKEAKLTSELATILDERSLTDIELETESLSIRVSRTPATQNVVASAPAMAAAPAPAPHLRRHQLMHRLQVAVMIMPIMQAL